MTEYVVTLNQPGEYRVGVDYEIPTKSIQYSNIILDDISSQFDGILTTFSLFDNGTSYVPINDQQLLVMVNTTILKPEKDYTVSGSNITFTTAPLASDDSTIVALASAADLTRTVNYVVDSGSIAMLPGDKGTVSIDVNGTIENLTIFSDQVGNLTLDILKSDFDTFPTFTSIVGGVYPSFTNGQKIRDDNLTGWTTAVAAGDVIKFQVVGVSDINRFTVSLKLKL